MAADRLTVGQVLRRFTLGSGPLKRGSDRLQFLARVLLVCSLLAAVPISLTAAASTHAQAQDEAAREAVAWHAVPARLTTDGRVPTGEVGDDSAEARGTAVWIDRTGTEHRAVVAVPLGARAGDTVSIWLDRDGNRTGPPMNASDVTGRAVSQGTGTFTMLAVIACCAYLWVSVLLERSRSRRWEAGWAYVEPQWSRPVS